jgi:hypothetical protein
LLITPGSLFRIWALPPKRFFAGDFFETSMEDMAAFSMRTKNAATGDKPHGRRGLIDED